MFLILRKILFLIIIFTKFSSSLQQQQQQRSGNRLVNTNQEQAVIESPNSIVAKLGETVLFKCKFKGLKGEPQWCLDDFCLGITKDLTLKGRSRHRIVGNQANGEYNLQIESVQLQDNMFYYCMATAASETAKAVKSAKASLTVITYPQLLHLDSPIHVSLNKPSIIQCIGYRSRPPIRVLVSIDGEIMFDETKYTIELKEIPVKTEMEKSELADIKNLQFNDQIKYFYYNTIVNFSIDNINMQLQGKQVECNAYEMPISENPIKMKNLKEISTLKSIMNTRSSIQVDFAPEINLKIISASDQLKENDVVSLVCSTKASPPVYLYKWYIGKEHLNGANSDTLNLKLRREMNLESISCEATNIIATVRSSLQLNINYKPYFLKGSHSYLLIDSQSCNKPITLDCQLESNPISNITWYKLIFSQDSVDKLKIGIGSTYSNAALNCGDSKVFKFNDTIENIKPEIKNQASNNDFGLYICEANNGLYEDDRQVIIKRFIKLNPLGQPAARLLIGTDEEIGESSTKYFPFHSTITISCIVDPLPESKGLIWLRENNKYLFDTKFIANENSPEINEDSLAVDYNYENYFLQELEHESSATVKNVTYKVNTEINKDGIKSFLTIKISHPNDFGMYKCRSWNKYGSKEVLVTLKEEKYNRALNTILKIYDKYPILYIIVFCLLSTIIILLISLLVICICKREKGQPLCYSCKNSFRKDSKSSYTNDSAIGIGVGSESSSSSIGVHATGVHSTGSSHLSSGFNEDKNIDEWLTSTTKLNNNTTSNPPCLVVSYNENKNRESELLLQKTVTPLTTVVKNYNLKDDDDDSDESLNKLLQDTSYRLSDLFKDLSPSLINTSNNASSQNTLKQYKTKLNSKRTPTTISTTNSSSSITTVTTNLSNTTPSKFIHNKSPRSKKSSLATSTFLPTMSLPPPPPQPTFYQTTIHSNMKNIPYTTLTKSTYPNRFYRSTISDKNNNNNIENEQQKIHDPFNEYCKLNDTGLNKSDNTFQTIV